MHPQSVRGVQDDPPVTEFVAEAFHDERRVGRHHAGGLSLVVEQLPQVVRGELVETHCAATLCELIAAQPGQFTGERADGGAEFGRSAHAVPAPERQPGRLSRRRHDQHPVMGDLGDPPARRAERDHVTRPRLVDHFLVEFAYSRRLFGIGGQVDGEQAAVGYGAAGRDRQPLSTRAGGQRAGVAVIHQPRPKFGELGGRVLAGQQIQRRLECAARQRRKWRAAPNHVEPAVGVQRLQCTGRDRVLRQHVERIGGHPHGLDVTGQHALHGDRAADEIGSVLGKQHSLGDLADLVTRAADALQTAGHRRRRLDLDHQIDRAHVDTQLQAGRRDHGLQPAALEVVLDLRALLLADRTVVRTGQQRRGAERRPAGHQLRREAAAHLRVALHRQLDTGAVGVNLVETRRESLGQPP